MREEIVKDYDDFTLRDYGSDELSGSLSPFTFLCVTAVLALFGLIMTYSASYDASLRDGFEHYHYLLENVTFGILAIVCGIILFFTPREKFEKLFFILFPISFIFLVFNALSNIEMGEIKLLNGFPNFISADFFILTSALSLSYLLLRIKDKDRRGFAYILIFALSLISTFLLSLSNSFTYSILFIFTTSLAIAHAKMEKRFTFFFILFNLTLFVFLVLSSRSDLDTIFSRLMPSYIDTDEAMNTSYALSAISEGAIGGKGIGSSYYKLGLIENVEDEYVFAVIAEELGLLGVVLIILFFLLFFFLCFRASRRSEKKGDEYFSILSITLSFHIIFKALLSIAAATALLPLSGISMPFFSANGFSYFVTILECSILYRAMHISSRGADNAHA